MIAVGTTGPQQQAPDRSGRYLVVPTPWMGCKLVVVLGQTLWAFGGVPLWLTAMYCGGDS